MQTINAEPQRQREWWFDRTEQNSLHFKKAIILIVDALRFDFVLPCVEDGSNLYFRNKLPIIGDLLKTQPEHSFLFQFVADPPTTTMQRLKALMTGGMPTFIDLRDNFESSAVSEVATRLMLQRILLFISLGQSSAPIEGQWKAHSFYG